MSFILQGSSVNEPDKKFQQTIEFIRLTVLVAATVQGHPMTPMPLLCLLDSGATAASANSGLSEDQARDCHASFWAILFHQESRSTVSNYLIGSIFVDKQEPNFASDVKHIFNILYEFGEARMIVHLLSLNRISLSFCLT